MLGIASAVFAVIVCPFTSRCCIETTGRMEVFFLHVGFLAPISHCVVRKFGYLQKLGHFPLELCPNSGLGKFRRGKSIALSTKLVVVGDAENAGMGKSGP